MPANEQYFQRSVDEETGQQAVLYDFNTYYKVQSVTRDVYAFFRDH